ncbi:adenosine receptor A2b-like [Acropora muricata]|uniref:adenosine receptor A2b-like n=1 Tax=Acropora muricata TaxID=159855 RepID=UPI0034E49C27
MNSTTRGKSDPSEWELFFVCMKIFLALATLFGNYIVIRAILKFPNLRTASNSILASLALVDILMVSVFILQVVESVLGKHRRRLCIVKSILSFSLNANIILHLALISVERVIAVKFALRYHTIVTTRRALIASIGVWMLAILLTIIFPQALKADGSQTFRKFLGGLTTCLFRVLRKEGRDFFRNSNSVIVYLNFLVAALLFLPISTVVISYGYIFNVAYRQHRRIQDEHTLQSITLTMKREMKAARTLAIVVGMCFISFVPLLLLLCLHFLLESINITKRQLNLAYMAASLNAFWNPLIYCWRNQHFKVAFARLLKCKQNH